MKVREIHITGFKSVLDQSVPLGRVNCFIGANGVGKSNVLEALGVLGAAATGRVDDEAIIRRGVRAGLPRLFETSFAGTQVPPHITLEAQGEPPATFRVPLLNPLDKPKPAWSFETEFLSSSETQIVSRGVRTDKDNLDETRGLSALKVVGVQPGDPASLLLKALQEYVIPTPNLDVEAQLQALPVAQRINKTSHDYRARERTIAEAGPVVRQRCTQAERFSTEIAAVGS